MHVFSKACIDHHIVIPESPFATHGLYKVGFLELLFETDASLQEIRDSPVKKLLLGVGCIDFGFSANQEPTGLIDKGKMCHVHWRA